MIKVLLLLVALNAHADEFTKAKCIQFNGVHVVGKVSDHVYEIVGGRGTHGLLKTSSTTFDTDGAIPGPFFVRFSGLVEVKQDDGFTKKVELYVETPRCIRLAFDRTYASCKAEGKKDCKRLAEYLIGLQP